MLSIISGYITFRFYDNWSASYWSSRVAAAEFTFFLAVPVMFGLSAIKIIKFGFGFTALELCITLLGMLVAFVVSLIVVKFLMNYIRKHDFKAFGWYRIILGIVILIYFYLIA